ncbi:MAG: lytic transglycosylase domain-containing protein [Alphaproteobacteria bacterium]|nr:lytic transglycosylase domain-containing protein [Alphaproteobacteria bacterium]
MCAAAIDRVELEERIPRALIRAIALTESGRRIEDRQANFAWPWTINANGEGRYFSTKAAAITEVKRLRAAGVGSIDVGCMQVNLHFHPKAFDSLEDAFDPARNVAYGAKYLKELQQLRRSWGDAVAYYHSANSEHSVPYRDRVYKAWNTERQRIYEEERAAILAAYAERRAELDRQREALRLAQARRETGPAAGATGATPAAPAY